MGRYLSLSLSPPSLGLPMNNMSKFLCSFFFSEKEESAIATIVIRGSTDNILDDVERAIDDGVNTFKALTKVSHLS